MNFIDDNSENWRMTVEKLRKFERFENISEEEAENIIDSLVQLAKIAYEIKQNNIDKKVEIIEP